MIRILHVVTFMGRGGLETVLMNYYRAIDRSKVQFDFLVHRDFRAEYDDEIEALGGRIYRLPRLIPWSLSYKNALNAFFRKHPEYKIVHVHQDCLSSAILKSAKENGVPVRIAHSHNNNQDKNLKYLIKLWYKRKIPKYSTELMACSKEAGNWMFGNATFHILKNAINANQLSFNKETAIKTRKLLSISENALVLGHIGRFEPQKNHSFLIDVFHELHIKRSNAVLILVGDGALRVEIENKAKALNLLDNVIFTGIRSDISSLLNAMDIFIMPSKYEGLGLAAIEAQASGLTCFVSDTVSKECNVTGLTHYYPLNASAENWADYILSNLKNERIDTSELIKKAGYDLAENALWLQNHYLKLWEDN